MKIFALSKWIGLRVLLFLVLALTCTPLFSQTFDFNIINKEEVCLEEGVFFQSPSDLFEYSIDACTNDFSVDPAISVLDDLGLSSRSYGYDLVFDGSDWFGFTVDRNSNSVTRFKFGSSPSNSPSDTVYLGNPDNLLIDPEGISIVKSGTDWFGFVPSFSPTGEFHRLDFGSSLEGIPTATALGNFSAAGRYRDVQIIFDQGEYFLFTANYSDKKLYVAELGASATNDLSTFTAFSIPNAGLPRGLDILKKEEDWYLFIADQNPAKVQQFFIGSSLTNTPVLQHTYTTTLTSPFRIDVIYDGGEYIAITSNDGGKPTLYNLGDLTGSMVEIDNSLLPNWSGFKAIKWDGATIVQGFESSRLNTAVYDNDCGVSVENSWSVSGQKIVDIFGINEFQQRKFTSDTLTVLNRSAPEIEFTIDASRCIDNANTFTPNLKGLTSYSWDFGDGNTSIAESPEYQYGATGTYTVRLDVSDGSCNNFTEQEITIYPAPPVPSFGVISDDLCELTLFDFTNTTDVTGFDDVLNYEWLLNGEVISTEKDISYFFETSGEMIVGLRSMLPGCESSIVTQTLEIIPAPLAIFSVDTVCLGQESVFDNLSEGANSYSWDFGDGTVSPLFEPTHQYLDTGTYLVSLTAFDATGDCETTVSQQLRVNRVAPEPVYQLLADTYCIGSEVTFTNLTDDVNFSDEVTYEWTVTDVGVFSARDTSFSFDNSGEKIIQLQAYYRTCESTIIEQRITINDLPISDFSLSNICSDNGIHFISESTNATIYSWDFGDGSTSSLENPQHKYARSGDYIVSLLVTDDNGCEAYSEQEITTFCAEYPSALYTLSSTSVCINESVELINNSISASDFEWDFCANDLVGGDLTSTSFAVSPMNNGDGYWLGEDEGVWYGFIASSGNHSIVRLDYGSDPTSTPLITDLGNLEGVLQGKSPRGIDLIEVDGNWFGMTGFQTLSSSFTLLDFGSSLENIPIATSIDAFGTSGRVQDLRLVKQKDSLILVFPFYASPELYRVNFGDSFYNTVSTGDIVSETISGTSLLRGFDLINYEGEWKSLIVSQADSKIYQIDLGVDLMSSMTFEGSHEIAEIVNPSKVKIIRDGPNAFAVVTSLSSNLSIVNFNDFSSFPSILNRGDSFERLNAIDVLKYKGKVLIQGPTSSTLFYSLLFEKDCGEGASYSTEVNPSLKYDSSAVYSIELRAKNVNDSISILSSTIIVLDQTAPAIEFVIDASRCISNSNTFTPTITGLTSYSWDFNNDGIADSNEENPSFDYSTLGAGSYTVQLDVSDGTCNNFIEEEITIFEPPPVPSYSFDASTYCPGASIDFTNTTSDASYDGPLTYAWEFIDDATATVVGTSDMENPSFAFDTDGNKTVRLTSSIPGCDEVVEQSVVINPPPNASFTAATVCQNEAMTFTNESVDAVAYLWNFGDGFTSTVENPDHIFSSAGNFDVALTVTNTNGCEHTTIVEVAVSDIPSVSFDFDIPCDSDAGVLFTDLSTVNNADLVSWTWFIAGEEVATDQNPTLQFDHEGIVNVSLAVTSSNGCESTHNEDIEIFNSPTPDFSTIVGCLGEETIFEDITSFPDGSIISRLWFINGESFSTSDVSYAFDSPGIYDITLEVTSQNFCSQSVSNAIEILQLPEVAFSVIGDCDNELIGVQDQSVAFVDQIVSRTWYLNDEVVGNGAELFLNNLPSDTYALSLEVETEAGCITNNTQTLEVNTSPMSSFASSSTYGLPEDVLIFTNSSTGATTFQWLLDGAEISTNSEQQQLSFTEAGSYDLGLVVQNSLGCSDTSYQELLIAIPEVDLSIGNFDLIENNGTGTILLEIQNFSNLPVASVAVDIVLENQFAVSEQVNQLIGIGESVTVSLNVRLPLTVSEPAYFCASLTSPYVGFSDIDPLNNEKCLTIQPKIKVEDPFPNPVTDEFRLKVITPEEGLVRLSLLNSAGKIQTERTYNASQGLNNFIFDMSLLDSGIYYISIEVGGVISNRKIIKL